MEYIEHNKPVLIDTSGRIDNLAMDRSFEIKRKQTSILKPEPPILICRPDPARR